MSFRQDFLHARMAKLRAEMPPEFANAQDGDDDGETEELDDFDVNGLGASTSASSSFLKPKSKPQGSSSSSKAFDEDYSPLSGSAHFSQALQVDVPSASGSSSFRVYYTPPSIASSADQDDDDEPSPVVFVCHHGAGYSALSFALLASEIVRESDGRAGVLAFDARGHGKTVVNEENLLDIETLANDLSGILKEVFPSRCDSPNLVLVGHSMGGSVVVKACPAIQRDIAPVVGVCNLDVVEGTAMEALSSMTEIIASRPTGFDSLEEAIQWHLRSRTIGNLASARISVPPLFIEDKEPSSQFRYSWRTDLAATQPYWEGWFSKLSSSFLSQRAAKLLVLAGAESLDKDLMIGQMQGKYQLSVFQDVGHNLQQDAPGRLANLLIEFWRRNEQGRDQRKILKNVKKVGQA